MSEPAIKAKRVMALKGITKEELQDICNTINQLEPAGVSLQKARAIVRAVLKRALRKGVTSHQINAALLPLNRVMSSILHKDLVRMSDTVKESHNSSPAQVSTSVENEGTDRNSNSEAVVRNDVVLQHGVASNETPSKVNVSNESADTGRIVRRVATDLGVTALRPPRGQATAQSVGAPTRPSTTD